VNKYKISISSPKVPRNKAGALTKKYKTNVVYTSAVVVHGNKYPSAKSQLRSGTAVISK
jgi:hypothetical protein